MGSDRISLKKKEGRNSPYFLSLYKESFYLFYFKSYFSSSEKKKDSVEGGGGRG